jgi:uncharacterized protein DUF1569
MATLEATRRSIKVKTARVIGRRTLKFTTLEDIAADVEHLVSADKVTALGNWTIGEALAHLANSFNMSIDGAQFRAPWLFRTFGPMFKNYYLTHPMKAGLKLPKDAARQLTVPPPISRDEGVAKFRSAMRRQQTIADREPSPIFGPMSRDEWDRLHMRHAELHLSFFVPS